MLLNPSQVAVLYHASLVHISSPLAQQIESLVHEPPDKIYAVQ